ncbi:unnamed protein product [Nesidiocoris tenuis]|uniref:Uncharacterized protein n=1 Tax=Nesidiocoris tenuis TaxID=355587 RepID=A0A6H5G5B5_9HEMI|nr:unnamed protein product [Nesidiocoris tenuis]
MRANFHQRPAALEESGRQPHNVITKITLFVNVCLSKSVLARESGLRLRLARSAGHQSPRSYKRGQYHKYRPRSFWYWPVVFQASFLMHIPQDEYLRHRSYGHPFDRRLHYRLSSRAVIETLLIVMNLIIHQNYQMQWDWSVHVCRRTREQKQSCERTLFNISFSPCRNSSQDLPQASPHLMTRGRSPRCGILLPRKGSTSSDETPRKNHTGSVITRFTILC